MVRFWPLHQPSYIGSPGSEAFSRTQSSTEFRLLGYFEGFVMNFNGIRRQGYEGMTGLNLRSYHNKTILFLKCIGHPVHESWVHPSSLLSSSTFMWSRQTNLWCIFFIKCNHVHHSSCSLYVVGILAMSCNAGATYLIKLHGFTKRQQFYVLDICWHILVSCKLDGMMHL